MQNPKSSKAGFISTVGRRKTAVARVRLYLKKGPSLVNYKPIEVYFPTAVEKLKYLEPLKLINALDKFSFSVKVSGSGKAGQLGAVVHGLSRALAQVDLKAYRPLLKQNKLLTRDQRMKERRKPGLAQAARAKKQSPKR